MIGTPEPTRDEPTIDIAVLLPCHNEERSIGATIARFRDALPSARIFVYDNRSTDTTAAVARAAGAIVREEPALGKGNVVRKMFTDIHADVYVIADGDDTYEPAAAPAMIEHLLRDRLDMVVGVRKGVRNDAHRRGHALGNRAFNLFFRQLFGPEFSDIFSGYRVLSRRFVKSFPALSTGFEVETEMSVHAAQLRMPVAEIETRYDARALGSSSKLRTLRDGAKILSAMILLFKEVRPMQFFGLIAALLTFTSLMLGLPLVETWRETGLVPRFPTAILATGLMILAALALTCGLILDSVARGRLEQKRFNYMTMPSPRAWRKGDQGDVTIVRAERRTGDDLFRDTAISSDSERLPAQIPCRSRSPEKG